MQVHGKGYSRCCWPNHDNRIAEMAFPSTQVTAHKYHRVSQILLVAWFCALCYTEELSCACGHDSGIYDMYISLSLQSLPAEIRTYCIVYTCACTLASPLEASVDLSPNIRHKTELARLNGYARSLRLQHGNFVVSQGICIIMTYKTVHERLNMGMLGNHQKATHQLSQCH